MDAKLFVKKHYNIDATAITKHPSKEVWLIKTDDEVYVLKDNQRFDYLQVENEANKYLYKSHITTREIIKNTSGYLCTGQFALFTYVPGSYKDSFSLDEIESSLVFLAEYNKALRNVPYMELDVISELDEVKDLNYLVNELPNKIDRFLITDDNKELLKSAVNVLKDNYLELKKLPKQLIHADLGADNFLFYKNYIYSIVDFTPDYDSEEFTLAQYIYWCIYHSDNWNHDKIDIIKSIYLAKSGLKDDGLLYPLLIKAALLRIVPNLLEFNNVTEKRYEFLKFLLKK